MGKMSRDGHANLMYMYLETVGDLGASTIRVHCDGKSASTRYHLGSLQRAAKQVLTHARGYGRLSETSRKGLDSE
jgi:hypothetical protein